MSIDSANNNKAHQDDITILGFGSLLSETSSRLTFPKLKNFRLGIVKDHRRVFCHAASIFFQRNIANLATMEYSSLSVEHHPGASLIVSVFEVPGNELMHDGVPSPAFLEREEEFNIVSVPYEELEPPQTATKNKTGIICTRSTDQAYIERWGQERFDEHYTKYGIHTIWGYTKDIRPCAVYLRHCWLAAQSNGETCFQSFLDDTYLVDRQTTIRQYLEKYPEVLDTRPPPELESRYCG